jgi:hypothetical protein
MPAILGLYFTIANETAKKPMITNINIQLTLLKFKAKGCSFEGVVKAILEDLK